MVKTTHKKSKIKLVVIVLAAIILSAFMLYGLAKVFVFSVDKHNEYLSKKLSSAALDYTRSHCTQQDYADTICSELVVEIAPPRGDFGGGTGWIASVYYPADHDKFSASMDVDLTIDGKTNIVRYTQHESSQ